jgi:hypothetical protein
MIAELFRTFSCRTVPNFFLEATPRAAARRSEAFLLGPTYIPGEPPDGSPRMAIARYHDVVFARPRVDAVSLIAFAAASRSLYSSRRWR